MRLSGGPGIDGMEEFDQTLFLRRRTFREEQILPNESGEALKYQVITPYEGATFPSPEQAVIRKYYIPDFAQDGQGIEVDPKTDWWFQFDENSIAVIQERAGATQQLLGKLYNPDNSLTMAALELRAETRGQIAANLNGLSLGSHSSALNAAPAGMSKYVHLGLWDPRLVFRKLKGERDSDYGQRLGSICDPLTMYRLHHELANQVDYMPIERDVSVDVKTHMLFISFYNRLDEAKKTALQEVIRGMGKAELKNFLNAFQVCELNLDLGAAILNIAANRGDADEIFRHFAEFLVLRDDVLEQLGDNVVHKAYKKKGRMPIELHRRIHEMDIGQFHLIFCRKGAEFLHRAASGVPFEVIERDFNPDRILTWNIFSSLAVRPDVDPVSSGQDAEMLTDIQSRYVQGREDMIVDPQDMDNPGNYRYPDEFCVEDYKRLKAYLELAYKHKDPNKAVDPEWCDYLIRNIAKDLTNPEVTFLLIKHEEELEAIAKIKPQADGSYYFGTHYVHPSLQRGLGIGKFVQKAILSKIPEGAKVVATVAMANPATERHIGNNGIGQAIVHEGDEKGRSKELLEFCWNYRGKYQSKDLSRTSVMAEAKSIRSIDEIGDSAYSDTAIFQVDSANKQNDVYVELCKRFLTEGAYVMTQFFTEGMDMSKAYVVFERSQEAVELAA